MCAVVIHVAWDVFFEFQVVFGCSVVVQVVFPIRAQSVGVVFQMKSVCEGHGLW